MKPLEMLIQRKDQLKRVEQDLKYDFWRYITGNLISASTDGNFIIESSGDLYPPEVSVNRVFSESKELITGVAISLERRVLINEDKTHASVNYFITIRDDSDKYHTLPFDHLDYDNIEDLRRLAEFTEEFMESREKNNER